ncbi:hypothetical protein FQA39_LY13681 [Lamprigera yunnana]|nr:hypothetical protein FQA39_LY13681 [Lamprigera yunnana]
MNIYLSILIFVLVTEFSNAQFKINPERRKNVMRMCSEKTNLTITNNDQFLKALIADKQQIQLFARCYLQEHGCLDDDGKILYNEIKKKFTNGVPPEKHSAIVNNCKAKIGNSTEETSYKFIKCVLSNALDTRIKLHNLKYQQGFNYCSKKTNTAVKNIDEYLEMLVLGGEPILFFSECLLKELRYMSNMGKILYDDIIKNVPPEISKERYSNIVNRCKIKRAKNNSEAAYQFSKCFFANNNINLKRQERHEKELRALKVCTEKYNVAIQKQIDFIKALTVGEEKLQHFPQCYLQELRYIDENGNILYDKFKKEPVSGIPSQKLSDIVDGCKSEKGKSVTETSFKFSKCVAFNVTKARQKQILIKQVLERQTKPEGQLQSAQNISRPSAQDQNSPNSNSTGNNVNNTKSSIM